MKSRRRRKEPRSPAFLKGVICGKTEMTVVPLSVLWSGKRSCEIRKVKNKQKALSARLELTQSTHGVGSSSDFPV